MELSTETIEFLYKTIYFSLYNWRLELANQEITSDFRILRSMQRPQIELQIQRLTKLSQQQQQATLTAFINKVYANNISGFKLSKHESELIELVTNLRPYTIWSDVLGDIHNPKYRRNKEIYHRKLFNRLKEKLKGNQGVNFINNNFCQLSVNLSNNFQVRTTISIDTISYSYIQDIYKNNSRIRFLLNYPVLIGFPCYGWAIYQEEDIAVVLDIILNCCEQFIEKVREILTELYLH